jgi:hypothetical protein
MRLPRRLALLAAAAAPLACHPAAKGPVPVVDPPWTPGVAYASPSGPVYRGLLDLRGLIHAHSVHSHDACDGAPTAGTLGTTALTLNRTCYDQFRDDLCTAKIDYVFLTDHGAMFDDTEYDPAAASPLRPETQEGDNAMLWSKSRGDQLVSRSGLPVANRIACPAGGASLIIPGNEGNNLMAVGLERHVSADPSGRAATYGIDTTPADFPGSAPAVAAAIATEKASGAVVLIAHPENLSKEELAAFPIDGFEMYNLHANVLFTDHGAQAVLSLIVNNAPGGNRALIPTNPNTAFLSIFNEDPRYLSRWAFALSQGQKRVTTMGSDCHQNAIPDLLSDGFRGDRYWRVMEWFTNHLLVTPGVDGGWDDQQLKAALSAGRLYGAFEALGYPLGFDFHAASGATVAEMGGDVALGATLSVNLPAIRDLDPAAPAPAFTVRLLRANGEAWDEVAAGPGDLAFVATVPGAYRAEVRMVPNHLTDALGPVAHTALAHDYVWIYANPIYVH